MPSELANMLAVAPVALRGLRLDPDGVRVVLEPAKRKSIDTMISREGEVRTFQSQPPVVTRCLPRSRTLAQR